jgi:hypothetical protein
MAQSPLYNVISAISYKALLAARLTAIEKKLFGHWTDVPQEPKQNQKGK